MEQLTLSLGEVPASRSPAQVDERAWMVSLVSCSSISELYKTFARNGFSGRTCQAYYPREMMPSSNFYPKWKNSGMAWHGERLTLNSSEWRNGASVCFLSDALEGGEVRQRYYSTAKACLGILNRRKANGKKLPRLMERVLTRQSRS